ncbi:MAG: hypothetical protein ABMA01_22590, partial [Chthoniobacteraceae bacterium]
MRFVLRFWRGLFGTAWLTGARIFYPCSLVKVKNRLKDPFRCRYPLRVPRKNPLPAAEIAICQRVRIGRERLGVSRVLFAQRAGIDSSVLANVEHCKLAVRYGLAKKLMRTYGINPHWLAVGEPPVVHRLPESLDLDELALDAERFSQVYNEGAIHTGIWKSEERVMQTWVR